MTVGPSEAVLGWRVVPWALVAGLLAAGVTGCGSQKTPAKPVASAVPPTILAAPVQVRTFAQVDRAMRHLYRAHPSIATFTVQDVEYTSKTRDRVLEVCQRGGAEKTASALESTRVLACAPLIFFFYSYGRMRSVPSSIDVARQLYWYAVAANQRPHDAEPGLRTLLRRWGVR